MVIFILSLFLYNLIKWKSLSRVWLFATPWIYSPWNSPSQNTGVDSLSLLQRIFLTQGLNQGLPRCRWILYQQNHQGSPRILEWVAYPFSSGSSWPRDQARVSHIAGGFLTSWATREAQETGVGSLSLLQWIFLTEGSNQSLLHCRRILYQLSYQGRPISMYICVFSTLPLFSQ